MKKSFFIWMLAAAVVLLTGSCKNGKSKKDIDDEPEVEETDDGAYTFPEADNPPAIDDIIERKDFTFTTELVTGEEGVAEKIIVKMKNNLVGHTYISEISAEPLDPDQWRGFGDIREDDINFDGYPDLMVCCGPFNSYGNFTYGAWLWNQKIHDFEYVKGFDELFDPEFNKKDKTVSSRFRMDDHEDDAVYKWNGNELELVSSETIIYSELEDE